MHDAPGPGTALLTGATGFVGSHLCRRLARDGWDVHVVVRPASDLAIVADVLPQITVHRHDGSTRGMADLVERCRPDTVFHLASLFLAQHRPEDIVALVESNVLFGTQLLEAMAGRGAARLVNCGTSWQHYGNADYSPVCLYAATKQAFDDILRYYVETAPLAAVTLELYDTYGPADPRRKLFSLLRKCAESGEPLAMSPGEQRLDLVYVDDAVEAFLAAAARLSAGLVRGHETYAVSSGAPVKLRDLVAVYSRVTGKTLDIRWGERPYRPREVMDPWTGRLPVPGWKPAVGIVDGIRRMEGLSR